jgi:hypothetical protein
MYAVLATIGTPGRCRKVNVMANRTKTYRDLDVWKLAMDLVETTYALTKLLPDSERYNLMSSRSDRTRCGRVVRRPPGLETAD